MKKTKSRAPQPQPGGGLKLPAEGMPKSPPAQEGDPQAETKAARAEPVLLPTVEQARAELELHPERTSVMSRDGVVVREPK